MNICEHLFGTAKLFPGRAAIVFDGRQLTYQQIEQQSLLAAAKLQSRGIMRGDRVALMLPNVPAFVVWYYAILRIGAVAVSVSTRLNPKEVAFIVADCQAKLLITDVSGQGDFATQLNANELPAEQPRAKTAMLTVSDLGDACDGRQLSETASQATVVECVETQPDEPALVLYTSGTTGFAKGATLSHKNVRATVHAFNHLCEMKTEDRLLLAVPLFHCYGQNALLNAGFNVGATIVLQRRFDLNESKQLISDHGVTKLFGVPTTFQLLCDFCEPEDLAPIGYCFSAAATLPIQLSRRWQEKFGMPIHEGYGLTETSPFASYNHALKFVPGSIGTPVDLVEMKIVDGETGRPCLPGELGEIIIRGPNVMLGYWNRPEDTAQAIRDGWFYSGDIGRMDEQGFFFLVDRVKDMIAIGGTKVFPAEVERILLDHPDISEAAVVGMPDEVFGEKVVAFLVLDEAAAPEETEDNRIDKIKSHCCAYLADYKAPKYFRIVTELPRNPAGKVLKTKLRELPISDNALNASRKSRSEQNGHENGGNQHELQPAGTRLATAEGDQRSSFMDRLASLYPAAREREIITLIQSELQDILDGETVLDATDRFVESGLDSIAIVELRDRLQSHFGSQLELPATLVFEQPRICDLSSYLADALLVEMPGSLNSSATKNSLNSQSPSEPDSNQASWQAAATAASKTEQNRSGNQAIDNDAVDDSLREAESKLLPETSIESMSEEEALDKLLREMDD